MIPDIVDAAQEYTERLTAAGIDALRIDHNAESATECRECDGEIPEPRRRAFPGVQTCVYCQQEIEDRERIMRGY
ncbi:TraR/DksA C4-type zinc finger protein [Pluralibacter gergoviae]